MNNLLLQPPFFILGNPRSGTTLFRLMLNSHPNIVVPPESGFIQWWYSKYKNLSSDKLLNIKFANKIIEDFLESKKIEDWGLSKNELLKIVDYYKPKNYSEFCILPHILYGLNRKKRNFMIGDKNNYYINHLDTLDEIFPQAKYIHLIRDGRDVACSYINLEKVVTKSKYKPNLPTSINTIAEEWAQNISRIRGFIESKDYIEIRYEDLLHNTEQTLIIVSEFLGVKFSDKMLDYYKESNFDEPLSTIDWKVKASHKIDKSNSNKYKKILSEEQQNAFIEIAGDVLKSYNYE